jgi:hypothetical protein
VTVGGDGVHLNKIDRRVKNRTLRRAPALSRGDRDEGEGERQRGGRPRLISRFR